MGETGMVRFRGNLNPTAREFIPGNHTNLTQLTPAIFRPPLRQVYYSFVSPYAIPVNEVRVDPVANGGVVYPQCPVNLSYVGPSEAILLPEVQPPSPCPTRSLLLSSVPIGVSEAVVRRDLEAFGDVRGVQMERLMRDGIVIVHFYDLRHAEKAVREINQHLQRQKQLRIHYNTPFTNNFEPPLRPARGLIGGCAVWAQFIIPTSNAVPDGSNQGTVIIFNLESDVSTTTLEEIFERFGPVKELRGTPLKKHQRFVEFFDVRDAAKALAEMNGKEIHGKPVVVEFSRPGGHGRKFFDPIFTSGTRRTDISPRHQQPPPRPHKFSGRLISNDPHRQVYSRAQFSPKKLHYMNSRSLNCADKQVEELQSLNFSGTAGNGIERRDFEGTSRRINAKKIVNELSPPISNQQAPQPRISVRLRKNSFLNKSDPRFLISENAMEEESHCKDSRTTVMIKNIPNKYSLNLLMNMLDNHCIHCNEQIADGKDLPMSSYDFVYLPIDFNHKCNVGYGFVNMTSPQGAWRLYKAFHLQHWEVFNSRKICQVTYARVQGLEALKEHFRKSKFPSEMEQYELPVVFSPPRDGIQLTEPLAVIGNMREQQSPFGPSTPKSSPAEDDDHEMAGGDGGYSANAVTADQSELLRGGAGSNCRNGGFVCGENVDDEDS